MEAAVVKGDVVTDDRSQGQTKSAAEECSNDVWSSLAIGVGIGGQGCSNSSKNQRSDDGVAGVSLVKPRTSVRSAIGTTITHGPPHRWTGPAAWTGSAAAGILSDEAVVFCNGVCGEVYCG